MKKVLLLLGLIAGVCFAQIRFIIQDKVEVNPYTEIVKTYHYVKAIEIYNDGKNIRVGFNETTTNDGDNYWIIPSNAVGFERDGLNIRNLKIRLRGDTSTDTGIVRINIYK